MNEDLTPIVSEWTNDMVDSICAEYGFEVDRDSEDWHDLEDEIVRVIIKNKLK